MKITNIQGTVELNNGVKMPYLGLGTYKAEDGQEVTNAVKAAIEAGYRHIDAASIYGNEEGVGQGIKESGIACEDLFVTSKVWNADQGFDNTLKAYDESLKRLGLDYLDLYLVHWPVEGKYKDTWKAMEKLYADGRVKAIGVSNFLQHQLEDLLQDAEVVPAVDQLEFHPYLVQAELLDFCADKGIQYEAWSPIMQGKVFEVPLLKELAEKYERSVVQLVLRWNLQKGVVTIPKSTKPHRIKENGALFDFEISAEDVARIDALDKGERIGPDPDNFDF